jgi:hypothetical protein
MSHGILENFQRQNTEVSDHNTGAMALGLVGSPFKVALALKKA